MNGKRGLMGKININERGGLSVLPELSLTVRSTIYVDLLGECGVTQPYWPDRLKSDFSVAQWYW